MDTQAPTIDNTLGAVFIGIVGASMLFGITSLQAYIYYHRYPRDSLLHRCSVGLLWGLDAFHQALTIHAVYYYMVSGFGNIDVSLKIVWSIKLQVAIIVLIILIVQSLYAHRVWLLSGFHRGILGYLVIIVVAAGCGLGIVFAYEIYRTDTFIGLDRIGWAVQAALASATAIDFLLSGAMCYYLWMSQSRGPGLEEELYARISAIMQYSLCSGLLTSTCSLATLFTYILLPHTLVFLGLEFLLTKLYVGSFFAMLNARKRRDIPQREDETEVAIGMSIRFASSTSDAESASLSTPTTLNKPKPAYALAW